MPESVPKYIPLDNAAQIFVSNYSKKETTLSRIDLTLNSPVDKEKLKIALKTVIKRFPYFQVYLKRRHFDYVFERTDDLPEIEDDTIWSNRYVDFKNKQFLIRVKAKDNTIAVESSHILTDGFGTMSFLLSLTAEYFRSTGQDIGDSSIIKLPGEKINSEEWECAYKNKFEAKGPPVKLPKTAYIPKAKMIPHEKYYNTRINMNLDVVRKKAKENNVTLNVYMSAVYIIALQELYHEEIKSGVLKKHIPIRLEIPVNLRRDYPSSCMKNFSYMYSPTFHMKEGRYKFDEIIKKISSDINHEKKSHSIKHQIARNLRLDNNLFFRFCPNFLKQLLFKFFYHLFGRSLYSGVFTNLGNIDLPEELYNEIKEFKVLPANTPVPGRNTSLFSFKGRLEMNIGSSCDDTLFEEHIINKLRDLSIDCEVIYNRDDPQV